MRSPRIATIACALGVVITAAACGGETAVVTVTTDRLPGTAGTATDSAAPTTPAAPTTIDGPTTLAVPDPPGSDLSLAERLPPAEAMPGTTTGSVTDLPTAESLTEALYAAGDPARVPAARNLEAAGFAGAVLRDDTGTDAQDGVALFRTYVVELGGPGQAGTEVVRSIQEVVRTAQLETDAVPVPGIPGATGISAEGSSAGQDLAVLFIAFPVDQYVYGLQVVARDRSGIDASRVLRIAQAQYTAAR
jgi:hypothetical protein